MRNNASTGDNSFHADFTRLTAGSHYYMAGDIDPAWDAAVIVDCLDTFEASSLSDARRKARRMGATSLWLIALEGGCLSIPV